MLEDDFDWSPLGENFWRDAAGACTFKPSEVQLRFAVCKHNGLTAVESARRAGYAAADDDSLRQQGSRAAKTTSVTELLAYAHAETGRGDNGIVGGEEAARILSRIARKADNNARIKALESLAKRDARAGGDVDTSKMVSCGLMYFRVLSGCKDGEYRKELWPLIWMEMILPSGCWNAPLIRQMAPYLKQHHPGLWDGARTKLAAFHPARLKQIEDGPVLTAAEIFEISRKNFMPLIRVIDITIMPEQRDVAEQELVRVGLMEGAL